MQREIELLPMIFENATYGLQVFNTITNLLGLLLFIPMTIFISRKIEKTRNRYNEIETRLDQLLLLSHEVYQTEVKEKRPTLVEKETPRTRPRPTFGETLIS